MSAKEEKRKSLLAGAASAALGASAPKNLLGYEKVYHGTSNTAAKSIRQGGLRKKYSGSGVAAADVKIGHLDPKDAKGKIYTTRNKFLADAHQPKMGNAAMGTTLKARVPYRAKKRLAEDTVLKNTASGKIGKEIPGAQRAAKLHLKDLRIYKHGIRSRFIEGSKDYAGRKQFATKGNMRRYLSQAGGKARFAKGVAQAAGSAGAGLYAIAKAIKAKKEAK